MKTSLLANRKSVRCKNLMKCIKQRAKNYSNRIVWLFTFSCVREIMKASYSLIFIFLLQYLEEKSVNGCVKKIQNGNSSQNKISWSTFNPLIALNYFNAKTSPSLVIKIPWLGGRINNTGNENARAFFVMLWKVIWTLKRENEIIHKLQVA